MKNKKNNLRSSLPLPSKPGDKDKLSAQACSSASLIIVSSSVSLFDNVADDWSLFLDIIGWNALGDIDELSNGASRLRRSRGISLLIDIDIAGAIISEAAKR